MLPLPWEEALLYLQNCGVGKGNNDGALTFAFSFSLFSDSQDASCSLIVGDAENEFFFPGIPDTPSS